MTIAFVGKVAGTLSNVTAVTAARNATNGNCLVIVGTGWNASGIPTTFTLTNSGGETVPAPTINFGPNAGAGSESRLAVWLIPVAHGGSSNTWTLTVSGAISAGSDLNIDVLEYSGLDAAAATDGTNTAQAAGAGPTASSVNTGNVVTGNANDLIFTAVWDQSNDQTFTYSALFTGRNNNQNPDAETSDEADQIVSATGTYSNTFTVAATASGNLLSAIIAIKAAAAGTSKSLTAQTVTSSEGSIVRAVTYALTGQTATFAEGTVSASTGGNVTLSLSAQTATLTEGTVALNIGYSLNDGVPLTGQTATFAEGSPTNAVTYSLTGQTGTFLEGLISSSVGGNVTISLSGQSVALSQGTVLGEVDYAVPARTATFAEGLLNPALLYALSGQSALAFPGTVTQSGGTSLGPAAFFMVGFICNVGTLTVKDQY